MIVPVVTVETMVMMSMTVIIVAIVVVIVLHALDDLLWNRLHQVHQLHDAGAFALVERGQHLVDPGVGIAADVNEQPAVLQVENVFYRRVETVAFHARAQQHLHVGQVARDLTDEIVLGKVGTNDAEFFSVRRRSGKSGTAGENHRSAQSENFFLHLRDLSNSIQKFDLQTDTRMKKRAPSNWRA